MEVQQPIATAKNKAEVGENVPALIKEENPVTGKLIDRLPRFATEVDVLFYVQHTGKFRFNNISQDYLSRCR